jgi:hypothetical protein
MLIDAYLSRLLLNHPALAAVSCCCHRCLGTSSGLAACEAALLTSGNIRYTQRFVLIGYDTSSAGACACLVGSEPLVINTLIVVAAAADADADSSGKDKAVSSPLAVSANAAADASDASSSSANRVSEAPLATARTTRRSDIDFRETDNIRASASRSITGHRTANDGANYSGSGDGNDNGSENGDDSGSGNDNYSGSGNVNDNDSADDNADGDGDGGSFDDDRYPPLVLVHGFAGSVALWCKNLSALAAVRCVKRYLRVFYFLTVCVSDCVSISVC